jgi:NADH-quinone oxidoreductase subunit A
VENQYAYVVVFGAVGICFVALTLTLARLIRPNRPSKTKSAPYECGIDPREDAWQQFNVRYYVFALLFVLFDVEAAYMYPWAIRVGKLGMFAFVEMAIFVGILAFGLGYAWRKGALRWE